MEADSRKVLDDEPVVHRNEITVPVNSDETDHQNPVPPKTNYLATVNLNIDDTLENHSNLVEMNKNYKSNQQFLNENGTTVPGGIDNPAFQANTGDEMVVADRKSTFNENHPYRASNGGGVGAVMNGTSTGTTEAVTRIGNGNASPVTEAVNLELIHMKPVNGGTDVVGPYENGSTAPGDVGEGMTTIPLKRDQNGGRYEEYFVPVNEHRKFMRGEKLYVTMDKRQKKTSKGQCLCWTMCFTLLLAAILVGILVAVGIIGNRDDIQPIEESARSLNGEPPIMEASFGPNTGSRVPSISIPENNVPRTAEFEIRVVNEGFSSDLQDSSSVKFKEMANLMKVTIERIFLHYKNDVVVQVIEFRTGSVIAKVRITWNRTEPDEQIRTVLKGQLDSWIMNNKGFLGSYYVKEPIDKVVPLLDICKNRSLNQCEDLCRYNYTIMNFECGCTTGKILGSNGTQCVLPEPVVEPTPEPQPEPEPTQIPSTEATTKEPHVEPTPEPTSTTMEESPTEPYLPVPIEEINAHSEPTRTSIQPKNCTESRTGDELEYTSSPDSTSGDCIVVPMVDYVPELDGNQTTNEPITESTIIPKELDITTTETEEPKVNTEPTTSESPNGNDTTVSPIPEPTIETRNTESNTTESDMEEFTITTTETSTVVVTSELNVPEVPKERSNFNLEGSMANETISSESMNENGQDLSTTEDDEDSSDMSSTTISLDMEDLGTDENRTEPSPEQSTEDNTVVNSGTTTTIQSLEHDEIHGPNPHDENHSNSSEHTVLIDSARSNDNETLNEVLDPHPQHVNILEKVISTTLEPNRSDHKVLLWNILNNVHSNHHFENAVSPKNRTFHGFVDVPSSTEDLMALETTTNSQNATKPNPDEEPDKEESFEVDLPQIRSPAGPQEANTDDLNNIWDEETSSTEDYGSFSNEDYVQKKSKKHFGKIQVPPSLEKQRNCTIFNEFRCGTDSRSVHNGEPCINTNAKCDGTTDCSSGSDEQNCFSTECEPNFQCKIIGTCLAKHLVCDGIEHCADGTDESECGTKCRNDELSCGAEFGCVPNRWRCDGLVQCPNGFDEQNCTLEHSELIECNGSDQFQCKINGECIDRQLVCSGIPQCSDGSDEWDCIRFNSLDSHLEMITSLQRPLSVCADNWSDELAEVTCRKLGRLGTSMKFRNFTSSARLYQIFNVTTNLARVKSLIPHFDFGTKCEQGAVLLDCGTAACGMKSNTDQGPGIGVLHNKDKHIQCPVAILSGKWALTTFSCFFERHENTVLPIFKPANWYVQFGIDSGKAISENVISFVPYPKIQYRLFAFTNEVVLIKMDRELFPMENPIVKGESTICLPQEQLNQEQEQECYVHGRNMRRFGDDYLKTHLDQVWIKRIVPTLECNSTEHFNGNLEPNQICVEFNEMTTADSMPCYDSHGAVLVCYSYGTRAWELQGFLSKDNNCGRSTHLYSIFTGISENIGKWIVNTIY